MTLSEDAKALIKEEIKTNLKKYKRTAREMSIYTWALRIIIPAIFAGGIAAYVSIESYVDRRIENRQEKVDHILIAQQFANMQTYSLALEELEEFQQGVKLDKVSPSLRDYYYLTAALILGNNWDLTPEGFTGQMLWNGLRKDVAFQRLIEGTRATTNQDVLNALGLCILKYDASNHDLDVATHYFETSRSLAKGRTSAADSFSLAMIALMRGDTKLATDLLFKAHEADPDEYPLNVDHAWLAGSEPAAWARIASAHGVQDITKLYENAASKLPLRSTK